MASEQVNVNGRMRTMEVTKRDDTSEKYAADLKRRGWDGHVYFVYGPRGAHKVAYRAADTGILHAV
jgi:hypothetical protein